MKIDVTKIENYEAMTPEEKLDAVLNYEFEAPAPVEAKADDGEVTKLKQRLNEVTSESANYRRQLHEKMTADEREKAEREEKWNALINENATLKREKYTGEYTTRYMGMGYPADVARALADTLPEGLPDSFFESQKSFLDSTIQNTKAQLLSQQPQPTQGSPLTSTQAEDLEMEKYRMYAGLSPKKK